MKYTVIWTEHAERQLTEIWLAAQDRFDVTEAARAIDELLERNPVETGESRGDELRIGIMFPLGVTFRV